MDLNGSHGLQGTDDEIPLVDRVNTEPPILKGLSSTESLWAIGLAFAVWVPTGAITGALVSSLAVGVLVTGVGALAAVWLAAARMQSV